MTFYRFHLFLHQPLHERSPSCLKAAINGQVFSIVQNLASEVRLFIEGYADMHIFRNALK